MGTIHRFEDLDMWRDARKLHLRIFELSQNTPLKNNFALRDQILRSSGSVMDNIAEGFCRDGNKEFCQFLSVAKGSIGETRSQLYRIIDCGYVSEDICNGLIKETLFISGKITNFMKYLKQSNRRGIKYD